MPSCLSAFLKTGLFLVWLGTFVPFVAGLAAMPFPGHEQPIARSAVSTYNVSFDSQEFDNLGDLDWRPISGPYQGLAWNYFRVGANRHFFQIEGGKDAFAAIPLDIITQEIIHTFEPSLSCVYNDSQVVSFKLEDLMFGCALGNGIPVECEVDFSAFDSKGEKVVSHIEVFTPPHAQMNDMGRLEAGKAKMQKVHFDSNKFADIVEVRFRINKFSVLYLPRPGKEDQQPIDIASTDSLLLVIDGVSYTTTSKSSTRSILEARSKSHTECFPLEGEITFNSLSIPYNDLYYDGFYRSKHLAGYFYGEPCGPKDLNASTGHIYAPGIKRYTDETASRFPSIGVVYPGSKRKDMSIKSFYLGCEQFYDDTSVLDTQIPCVIGIISAQAQKHKDKPQDVHYQQIPIIRATNNPPENIGFEFVELAEVNRITRVHFILISADPNATSVSVLVDNLTYSTRNSGKGPRIGNNTLSLTNDSLVDSIVTAITNAEQRNNTATIIPDITPRGNPSLHKNITINFNSLSTLANSNGDFSLTSEDTSPLTFLGPNNSWMGRAQDAQGAPSRNLVANNHTWTFAPLSNNIKRFAYVELPWSERGMGPTLFNGKWATISLSNGSEYSSFSIKRSQLACYPAFLAPEDTLRISQLGNDFECHFTILGYKAAYMDEPAEHAIDFTGSSWKEWRDDQFPRNFNNLAKIEIHVTYASTRNVRLFVGDIEVEMNA